MWQEGVSEIGCPMGLPHDLPSDPVKLRWEVYSFSYSRCALAFCAERGFSLLTSSHSIVVIVSRIIIIAAVCSV